MIAQIYFAFGKKWKADNAKFIPLKIFSNPSFFAEVYSVTHSIAWGNFFIFSGGFCWTKDKNNNTSVPILLNYLHPIQWFHLTSQILQRSLLLYGHVQFKDAETKSHFLSFAEGESNVWNHACECMYICMFRCVHTCLWRLACKHDI